MTSDQATQSSESNGLTEEHQNETSLSLNRRELLKKTAAAGVVGMSGITATTEIASAQETDASSNTLTMGPESETNAADSEQTVAAAGCGLPGVSFVSGGAQIDISEAGRGYLASHAHVYADCILDASYYLDVTCGRTRAGVAAEIELHCAAWWQSVVNLECGGD